MTVRKVESCPIRLPIPLVTLAGLFDRRKRRYTSRNSMLSLGLVIRGLT